ncbi:3-oxoacyl-[acyl-carrier-protein] synthase III C-terminal domain-containing protein [Streptomyces sp. NPDC056528]|uniref:3-oxoacyl-[acyl-carrier-protein] synthase III C-terminal domain-containing protein n=1 Tax=Streptomyces sp. NPDC056528 TaxID=3345854 RepID=UPI00368F95B0
MLYIKRVSPFIPPHRVTVSDLKGELGLTEAQVQLYERFLGMRRIAVAPDHSVLDMLLAAAQDALAGADRDALRYMIHAHTMQHAAPGADRLLDGLRAKLGLEHVRGFGLSHQNCAVGLYALRVAEALLALEPAGSTLLLVGGEKVPSPVVQKNAGLTLLGEAAAACLLGTRPPGHRVLSTAYRVLGEFHDVLDMPEEKRRRYEHAYVPTIASVMTEAASAAGLAMADLSVVVPHNVNRLFWRQLSIRLDFPIERVFLDNVGELGHCFCVDPFVNFVSAESAGRLPLDRGGFVLLVSAGLGATFSAAVVHIGEGNGK